MTWVTGPKISTNKRAHRGARGRRSALAAALVALSLLAGVNAELSAGDAAPPDQPPPLAAPAPAPVPAPASVSALAPPPINPPVGLQEGPYYSQQPGTAGLLFDVSRSLDGVARSRVSADLRLAYARDWHRGDGGLGDWLGLRGGVRYRSTALRVAYDDRRFGPARAVRFQAAHLLLGGVVPRGDGQPFDEGGFGLCCWWPHATGRVRVVPEVGFRSTWARWPVYRASLAAFRRGEAQDNGSFYVTVETYGSAGWTFKSEQGWIYDGGAQVCLGLGSGQVAAGYHLWGLRRHFAQGPVCTATWYF